MRKKGMNDTLQLIIAVFFMVAPYVGMIFVHRWYRDKAEAIENARFIVVSKQEMRLLMYDYTGKEMFRFPMACGQGLGNKEQRGDMRTPEGIFRVSEIQKADHWEHDFRDGKGAIKGAYGPFFIRLEVPGHTGIGIHGTHDPTSLGARATEGCIRLNNSDLERLVKKVHPGTVVIITAAKKDL
ncbi:L,D-transpeptidase [Bacteroidia bacterium]|nr:L,D-transpeptidase [Bacteroidia bacterium]